MPVLKNPKHERFAQELAKGETADEAYQLAGYSENRGNAVRLKANESVMKRVKELQSRAADKAVVTIQTLTQELEEARALALKEGQPSAAVSATLGKAKLHGIGSETTRLTGANGGPVEMKDVSARDLLAGKLHSLSAGKREEGDTGKPH
jgi:phage terminase small subunit